MARQQLLIALFVIVSSLYVTNAVSLLNREKRQISETALQLQERLSNIVNKIQSARDATREERRRGIFNECVGTGESCSVLTHCCGDNVHCVYRRFSVTGTCRTYTEVNDECVQRGGECGINARCCGEDVCRWSEISTTGVCMTYTYV